MTNPLFADGPSHRDIPIVLTFQAPDRFGWFAEVNGQQIGDFLMSPSDQSIDLAEIQAVLVEQAKQTIDSYRAA
jgi:hypothetical protein